jgi:hypothetical protein
MKQLDKRKVVGWIAVSLSIVITCFWAFWGIIETFHEGWYYESWLSNVGLMFVQYLSPMLIFMGVTLVCCDNLENETPRNVLAYFRIFSKFMDAPQVGVLVRNGGRLSGHGKDPEREKRVPRIFDVYEAYEQAGRELATEGRQRGTSGAPPNGGPATLVNDV